MKINVDLDKIVTERIKKNKKGFTLIELIVSVVLIGLVLTMIYSFFNTSNNLFKFNERRSDAQAQLRSIMDGLKNDVKTSSHVAIMPDVSTAITKAGSLHLSNYRIFYADTVDGSNYTILKRTSGSTEVAYANLPLKSLTITFSYDDQVATHIHMLHVSISTSEGYSLSADLIAPNPGVNIYGESNVSNPSGYSGQVLLIETAS